MKTRKEFPEFLNSSGLVGVGAEIGVQKGVNAQNILSVWKGQHLHLVDLWAGGRGDKQFKMVHDRFKDVSKVTVWRGESSDIAINFTDQFLDWVYIDAGHDYKNVCTDLMSWIPKVKVGGLIAGHDYRTDGKYWDGMYGVKRAVDNLKSFMHIDLRFTDEGDETTWYFFK